MTLYKQIAMRHTHWIDQCCTLLQQQNEEYENDVVVVGLIRLHVLARRLGEIVSGPGSTQSDLRNEPVVEMIMRSFQEEFAQVEANLAGAADSNCRSNP